MYIADLHIHSKYSRATSRDCDAPHLDLLARIKGISLVGTGDFTHPKWRQELEEALLPCGNGLYELRPELRLPGDIGAEAPPPKFAVTGELSSIYKKNGKTRKVHNVIILPDLESADELSRRLEAIGNIRSDGRPILGLDSRDLLEMTLDACPRSIFIPAHIWTPHFSLFGAFSGFDTIEECFEDLTCEIHALETGLSSDPPMNYRVSALDRFTLVSNSDAHSPAKLGREANLIEGEPSYDGLYKAIQTGEGFAGTLEFFPEEGKYHLDGHRACGARLEPERTAELGGLCPVCGKPVTIGVQHRVAQLADRPAGYTPEGAKPFFSLVPLQELIASAMGVSTASKKVSALYDAMIRELGPEFRILRDVSPEDIERAAGPCVAEGVRRVREGRLTLRGGFDGQFGDIVIFTDGERQALMGQAQLFSAPAQPKRQKKAADNGKVLDAERLTAPTAPPAEPNAAQREAVTAPERAVAVIAGPGTGKTGTLVRRIAYLIEQGSARPSEITAVTFTNAAAAELKERLEARLGGRSALRGMTVGTFHEVCLKLTGRGLILSEGDRLAIVSGILAERGVRTPAAAVLRAISGIKNSGALLPERDGRIPYDTGAISAAGLIRDICEAYDSRVRAMGARDLDDVLTDALAVDVSAMKMFRHLLIDEFQDVNPIQRRLARHWSKSGASLFVIGDPDQSIYGFRGASAKCFEELREDFPDLRTIALSENYRSTPQIVSAAMAVISNNSGSRQLRAVRPDGAAVRFVAAGSAFEEGIFIAREIAHMTGGMDMQSAGSAGRSGSQPRAFSDIAVLCRTNRQLSLIETCLLNEDIPCIAVGRGEELEEPPVESAWSFFGFVSDPANAAALTRHLSLAYGLEPSLTEAVFHTYSQGERPEVGEPLPPVLANALRAAGCPPAFFADYDAYAPLIRRSRPHKLLERWFAGHGVEGKAARRFTAAAAFHRTMAAFLHVLAVGEEADLRRATVKSYPSGAVRLMTIHGSKGLEFPAVFLAGLGEGLLPLAPKGAAADTEEERRLMFVAMTRARDELIITGPEPLSPFCGELPLSVLRGVASEDRRRSAPRQLRLFCK